MRAAVCSTAKLDCSFAVTRGGPDHRRCSHLLIGTSSGSLTRRTEQRYGGKTNAVVHLGLGCHKD
jgi:hypothetical protein